MSKMPRPPVEAGPHRNLVEGGRDRDQPRLADRVGELPEFILRKACRLEARKMRHVLTALEVGVDEGVQISELKLDGRLDLVSPGQPGHCVDDRQAVRDLALVVVRHLEDVEIVEQIIHRASSDAAPATRRGGL